jgi:hypothetical protein
MPDPDHHSTLTDGEEQRITVWVQTFGTGTFLLAYTHLFGPVPSAALTAIPGTELVLKVLLGGCLTMCIVVAGVTALRSFRTEDTLDTLDLQLAALTAAVAGPFLVISAMVFFGLVSL